MLDAAKAVGITSIVCTPHCRDPYFDYEAMWKAFRRFRAVADIPVSMGFEVNVEKLRALGMGWAPRLGCGMQEPDELAKTFLLELQTGATEAEFDDYERVIYELQGLGFQVIIAHPERYRAIQKDICLAERLVELGCKLQASADFIKGGRLGKERRPAKRMFEANLYSYIASDAHRPEHYRFFAEARAQFKTRGIHMR